MRVAIACAMLIGCGHNWAAGVPGKSTSPPAYRLTVVGATIEARRPDGSPWRTSKPDKTMAVLGMAAGIALGQAALGTAVGELLSGEEHALAPAPFVEINVGGVKYETAALQPTLSPTWNQVLLIDAAGVHSDDVVVISVRDGVDGQTLSTTQLTFSDLVSRPSRTFAGMTSVPSLNVYVTPTTIEHTSQALHIPGDGRADLAVRGGDTISIESSGSVCVVPGKCFGPDGDPELRPTGLWGGESEYKNSRSNPAGYQTVPHASLVGMIDDIPIYVGHAGSFRVPRDATLRLFVNDIAPENNTGAFDAIVHVNP